MRAAIQAAVRQGGGGDDSGAIGDDDNAAGCRLGADPRRRRSARRTLEEIAAIFASGEVTMTHGCLTSSAGHLVACLRGWLATGSDAATPPHGHGLAFAALVSWLVTEGLGAFMLASLSAGLRGRRPARPAGVWAPVAYGHAGLALTGFTCWIGFLVTGARALAWPAVGLLALAIGLGVSTVTIWTPYPAPARAEPVARGDRPDDGSGPPQPGGRPGDLPAGLVSHEALARALSDEALASKLVDDLLASMLAEPAPRPRTLAWSLAPLIPVAHGVLAITTFLLVTLAAIGAG